MYLSQLQFFFYLGTPSTSVPTSNPSCSTSSAVANASDLQLTDREKARLDELFMASRALVEPVEHERDVRNSILLKPKITLTIYKITIGINIFVSYTFTSYN